MALVISVINKFTLAELFSYWTYRLKTTTTTVFKPNTGLKQNNKSKQIIPLLFPYTLYIMSEYCPLIIKKVYCTFKSCFLEGCVCEIP